MELLYKLLDSDDEKYEKKGLQDLCELLEKGYMLNEVNRKGLYIRLSKFQKSNSTLVRRWLYKSIGLLNERDYVPFLTSQLSGIEEDSENKSWIVAALYHLTEKEKASKIIYNSQISFNALLSAGFYEPIFLPRKKKEIKKLLDSNDTLSLKWFSLLYGNSLDKFQIDKSKLKDFLTRLNKHEDNKVAEYSIWALHKSEQGRFTDCTILPHEISNHQPNIRRWLYRLITKDMKSIVLNYDLVKTAIVNESDTSAREGLATGLGKFAYANEVFPLYNKWFSNEKNSFVRIQLLRNISDNAATNNLYQRILKNEIANPFDLISKHIAQKGLANIQKTEIVQTNINFESTNEDMTKTTLPTVVILTAILEEYLAVKQNLPHTDEVNKEDTYYEAGIFEVRGRKVANVIIRECGSKNTNASQETERAINNFNPDIILFVGIAGSRKPKDFTIGDVIFPEKIYSYEAGKSEKDAFMPRPDLVNSNYTLYEIAKKERRNDDWKSLIKNNLAIDVKADLGVIASGEQLVEHYDSEIGKILTKYYPDTSAVEMEGFGFAKAATRQGREKSKILIGVVRGISDIIEQLSSKEQVTNDDRRPDSVKQFASDTAAAFAFWLIFKSYEK